MYYFDGDGVRVGEKLVVEGGWWEEGLYRTMRAAEVVVGMEGEVTNYRG